MNYLKIILPLVYLLVSLPLTYGDTNTTACFSQSNDQELIFYSRKFYKGYMRVPLVFPYQVVRLNHFPQILNEDGHVIIESPASIYCDNNYIFGLYDSNRNNDYGYIAFIIHVYDGYVEKYSNIDDFNRIEESLMGSKSPQKVPCALLLQDFSDSGFLHFNTCKYNHINRYDNTFGMAVYETNCTYSARSKLWPDVRCLDFGAVKANSPRRVLFEMMNSSNDYTIYVEEVILSKNTNLVISYRTIEGNIQTSWKTIDTVTEQGKISVKPNSQIQFAITLNTNTPPGRFVEGFSIKNSDIKDPIKFTVFGEKLSAE